MGILWRFKKNTEHICMIPAITLWQLSNYFAINVINVTSAQNNIYKLEHLNFESYSICFQIKHLSNQLQTNSIEIKKKEIKTFKK